MSAAIQPYSDKLEYTLRGLQDDDWALIQHSWSNSLRDAKGSPVAKRMGAHVYYPAQRESVERLRERGVTWAIACDPDDPSMIIGWACGQGPVLHYVYVKQPFRQQGVARALVCRAHRPDHSGAVYCSHWTAWADEILAAKTDHKLVRVDTW